MQQVQQASCLARVLSVQHRAQLAGDRIYARSVIGLPPADLSVVVFEADHHTLTVCIGHRSWPDRHGNLMPEDHDLGTGDAR